MDFELSIENLEGKKVINFFNNTNNFIEVIFTIDDIEVKNGESVKDSFENIRGYAYTPKLEKPVKRMKDDSPLQFDSNGGEVIAYIFEGEGKYKDEDLEKPTFLRNKLVDKVSFKRKSNKTIKVLKIKY